MKSTSDSAPDPSKPGLSKPTHQSQGGQLLVQTFLQQGYLVTSQALTPAMIADLVDAVSSDSESSGVHLKEAAPHFKAN